MGRQRDEKDRYFIVLAAAGHSGARGKCVPILQVVTFDGDKEVPVDFVSNPNSPIWMKKKANEIVRGYGRVKHDQDGAILTTTECTYHEMLLVKFLNNSNPFLTKNDNSENGRMSLCFPGYVKIVIDLYYETKNPDILDQLSEVEVKDDFKDEDQILQRFVAPREKMGSKCGIEYDHNYSLDSILAEYFTAYVRKYALVPSPTLDGDIRAAINNKITFTKEQKLSYEEYIKNLSLRTTILVLYYGLFGEDNPLHIHYNGKRLRFHNNEGKKETIEVPHGEIRQDDTDYAKLVKAQMADIGEIKPIYAAWQKQYI